MGDFKVTEKFKSYRIDVLRNMELLLTDFQLLNCAGFLYETFILVGTVLKKL